LTGLLLDSHALLWWQADDPRLGADARKTIERPGVALYFSSASVWELAIKQAQGKVELPDSLLDVLAEEDFVEIRISAAHGLLAGALPLHHKDPFDRMIVAQAKSEGLTVVTCDELIAAYGVPVLW
jgi:PIN domain nuclease of toxin-antitoxin system